MMIELRHVICKVARRIVLWLEEPSTAIQAIQFQPVLASTLRVALDAGWLEALSDSKAHKAETILRDGQDLELLVRIFRVLAAADVVREVSETTFQANRRTQYILNTGVRAGLAHWFDNMAPAFTGLPTYLKTNSYREPQDSESGPYSFMFDDTYWNRLSKNPKLYEDLNTYMMAHKKIGTSLAALYPRDRLVAGFDKKISEVLLIDVGGGKGHQLLEICTTFPSLPGTLVLQDLAEVLPSKEEANGIKCVPHNFFEKQPIHGARYYYFSAILHDWPNAKCHEILRQTVHAMEPGYSKLLINGIILPETKASFFEACKDLGMMAAMSAKERTLKQLKAMTEAHGLQLDKIFDGPRGRDGIIEFSLPKVSEGTYNPTQVGTETPASEKADDKS